MKCYDICPACKDPDKGWWHIPIEPKSGDRIICRTIPKNWIGNCSNPKYCEEHECGEDYCNCPKIFNFTFPKEEENE